METATKTYAEFVEERDKLISLALSALDIEDLPDINGQLVELANQAAEAGYGGLVAAERNYRPSFIRTFPTVQEAIKAYVDNGKYDTVYYDSIADKYLLDLSGGDLKEWLGYFYLSKWGGSYIANETMVDMIQACSHVDDSQTYLNVYRVPMIDVKQLTLENE